MKKIIGNYRVGDEQRFSNGTLLFNEIYAIKDYTNERFPPERTGVFRQEYNRSTRFFSHMRKILYEFRRTSRLNGNLNVPIDVFREGVGIYKVSNRIKDCGIDAKNIHLHLSLEQIDVLIKSILAQMLIFEQTNLIHCDLKPENIIICKRNGLFIGSIIDYDNGFFRDSIPNSNKIVGTPEYWSPEVYGYVESSQDDYRNSISCASDMFSIGCLYYLYLTGKVLGDFDNKHGASFVPPAELLINLVPLNLDSVDAGRRSLLKWMLMKSPTMRPTARQAIDYINWGTRSGYFEKLNMPFGKKYLFDSTNFRVIDSNNAKHLLWNLADDWSFDAYKKKNTEPSAKNDSNIFLSFLNILRNRGAAYGQLLSRANDKDCDEELSPLVLQQNNRSALIGIRRSKICNAINDCHRENDSILPFKLG